MLFFLFPMRRSITDAIFASILDDILALYHIDVTNCLGTLHRVSDTQTHQIAAQKEKQMETQEVSMEERER